MRMEHWRRTSKSADRATRLLVGDALDEDSRYVVGSDLDRLINSPDVLGNGQERQHGGGHGKGCSDNEPAMEALHQGVRRTRVRITGQDAASV